MNESPPEYNIPFHEQECDCGKSADCYHKDEYRCIDCIYGMYEVEIFNVLEKIFQEDFLVNFDEESMDVWTDNDHNLLSVSFWVESDLLKSYIEPQIRIETLEQMKEK